MCNFNFLVVKIVKNGVVPDNLNPSNDNPNPPNVVDKGIGEVKKQATRALGGTQLELPLNLDYSPKNKNEETKEISNGPLIIQGVNILEIVAELPARPRQREMLFGNGGKKGLLNRPEADSYINPNINNEKELIERLTLLGGKEIVNLTEGDEYLSKRYEVPTAEKLAAEHGCRLLTLEELSALALLKKLLEALYPDEKGAPEALLCTYNMSDSCHDGGHINYQAAVISSGRVFPGENNSYQVLGIVLPPIMFLGINIRDIYLKLSPEQKGIFSHDKPTFSDKKKLRKRLELLDGITEINVLPGLHVFDEAERLAKEDGGGLPTLEELLAIFTLKELLEVAYPDGKGVPEALKKIYNMPIGKAISSICYWSVTKPTPRDNIANVPYNYTCLLSLSPYNDIPNSSSRNFEFTNNEGVPFYYVLDMRNGYHCDSDCEESHGALSIHK